MEGEPSEAPRRLEQQTRRSSLVRAAAEAFAENGFDQSTLRDIASRARVTTPILYRFFDSRLDLYRVVIEEAAGTLIDLWSSAPPTGSSETFFKASTSAFFSWIEQHRQAWRLLFADQPRDVSAEQVLAQVRSAADQAMGRVLTTIGVGVPGGLDVETFPSMLAAQVTGAGNALASWWWSHQEVPATDVARTNHALVWEGLATLVATEATSGWHRHSIEPDPRGQSNEHGGDDSALP